jgi:hypothetical protein
MGDDHDGINPLDMLRISFGERSDERVPKHIVDG